MSTSNESKAISHFHIGNDIVNIVGRFSYRKFEPFEQVDEQLEKRPPWCGENEDYPIIFPIEDSNVPRYVELSWEGGIIKHNYNLSDLELIQGRNIFFNCDLQQEAVLFASDEQKILQQQSQLISDEIVEKDKLNYLLSQTSENQFTEQVEINLRNGAAFNGIPVLDPVTNKPIQRTSVLDKKPAPDVLLDSKNAASMLGSSYRSGFTGQDLSDQLSIVNLIAKKINSYQTGTYFKNFLEAWTNSDELNKTHFPNLSSTGTAGQMESDLREQFQLVGYVVLKYRVEYGQRIYMYSRFVSSQSYRDPYVAYGKVYQYEIRPVYGLSLIHI